MIQIFNFFGFWAVASDGLHEGEQNLIFLNVDRAQFTLSLSSWEGNNMVPAL